MFLYDNGCNEQNGCHNDEHQFLRLASLVVMVVMLVAATSSMFLVVVFMFMTAA